MEKIIKFPAAPLLLPVVFPTKVVMNFGEPILFSGDTSREYLVAEKVDMVKDKIKDLIAEGLKQRKGIFS